MPVELIITLVVSILSLLIVLQVYDRAESGELDEKGSVIGLISLVCFVCSVLVLVIFSHVWVMDYDTRDIVNVEITVDSVGVLKSKRPVYYVNSEGVTYEIDKGDYLLISEGTKYDIVVRYWKSDRIPVIESIVKSGRNRDAANPPDKQ